MHSCTTNRSVLHYKDRSRSDERTILDFGMSSGGHMLSESCRTILHISANSKLIEVSKCFQLTNLCKHLPNTFKINAPNKPRSGCLVLPADGGEVGLQSLRREALQRSQVRTGCKLPRECPGRCFTRMEAIMVSPSPRHINLVDGPPLRNLADV